MHGRKVTIHAAFVVGEGGDVDGELADAGGGISQLVLGILACSFGLFVETWESISELKHILSVDHSTNAVSLQSTQPTNQLIKILGPFFTTLTVSSRERMSSSSVVKAMRFLSRMVTACLASSPRRRSSSREISSSCFH